ncbi:MAG: LemA family protein, partial [Limisphaerales bacterium]
VARRDFNDAVQSYDTRLKSFPTVLYAGMMGFKEKPYFTATPGAETAPKVQFDFNSKAPAAKP